MNERLKDVTNFLIASGRAYNQKDLCDKLGKNPSVFSEMLSGKRIVSANFANRLCEVFALINPDYLLDKDCKEMLRLPEDGEMPDINNLPERKSEPMDYVAIIKAQQEQIDRLLTIIEQLTTK